MTCLVCELRRFVCYLTPVNGKKFLHFFQYQLDGYKYLGGIGQKHKKYVHDHWRVFTPRHKPGDTLLGHLTFALKYEGVDLAVLNALFKTIEAHEIETLIRSHLRRYGQIRQQLFALRGPAVICNTLLRKTALPVGLKGSHSLLNKAC